MYNLVGGFRIPVNLVHLIECYKIFGFNFAAESCAKKLSEGDYWT